MNGEFINLDTAKKIQEDKNMDKDLLKIIECYGILSQLKYFQSEVFELNEAIIKRETEYGFCETSISMEKENLKHITEELADVMVMLMQFKEYYHIDGNEIMKIMREKIDRQLGRIENESK